MVAAFALFLENHVAGSAEFCGAAWLCKSADAGDLAWLTQAERWESDDSSSRRTYLTRSSDTLASVALIHGTDPATIAVLNPRSLIRLSLGEREARADQDRTPPDPERPAEDQQVAEPSEEPARAPDGREDDLSTLADAEQALAGLESPWDALKHQRLRPGQQLTVPAKPPYDPRQWADWLLWALIGICAYLLIEITKGLRDVVYGGGDFLGEASWYWTQLLVGPLIAFVIVLFFTHVDIDLVAGGEEAAAEVNLREYPVDLLIVPSFLLGFYSRVAREVLDRMMRAVFRSAWRAAHGGFEVVIKGREREDEITDDKSVVFETRPPTIVAWSATEGSFGQGGQYTPPDVEVPTKVHVTAVATASGETTTKTITVKPA